MTPREVLHQDGRHTRGQHTDGRVLGSPNDIVAVHAVLQGLCGASEGRHGMPAAGITESSVEQGPRNDAAGQRPVAAGEPPPDFSEAGLSGRSAESGHGRPR